MLFATVAVVDPLLKVITVGVLSNEPPYLAAIVKVVVVLQDAPLAVTLVGVAVNPEPGAVIVMAPGTPEPILIEAVTPVPPLLNAESVQVPVPEKLPPLT